jgi:hypothetical protein
MSAIINLETIAQTMVQNYGVDDISLSIGVKPEIVETWRNGQKPPTVPQLNKLLEMDPSPIHAAKPLYDPIPEGKRLAILMATSGSVHPKTMESIFKLFDPTKMVFKAHSFNSVYHNRNWLAHWFLTSTTCEWAWQPDADMVFPCGDGAWFKSETENPTYPDVFAGAHTIGQLLGRKKTLIGACYFGRRNGLPAQFAGGQSSKEVLARGPSNEIREVAWVGCGSLLIHRSVFEDIIKTQPEVRIQDENTAQRFGFRHHFYDPVAPGWNDDPSLCDRARRAGHPAFVDMSVMPAHSGDKWYNFQHQQNTP